jgi:hypothetical protein
VPSSGTVGASYRTAVDRRPQEPLVNRLVTTVLDALSPRRRRARAASVTDDPDRRALHVYAHRRAVLAAANLLDRRQPDWRSRVRPDLLDMADEHMCVLGQVFGDYLAGMIALYDTPYRRHVAGPSVTAFDGDFPAGLWREVLDPPTTDDDRDLTAVTSC